MACARLWRPGDPVTRHEHTATVRLRLDAVTYGDLEPVHALHADPGVWCHFPSGRHTSPRQTAAFVVNMERDWSRVGLGYWAVRRLGGPPDGLLLGVAGCAVRYGSVWNLYYRFAPAAQGQGFAAETVAAAQAAARLVHPGLPVIASLLEHNAGSKATAERAGLRLAWRGPDADRNPDPGAVRLIYADRELDRDVLAALTRGLSQLPEPEPGRGHRLRRWPRLGRGRAPGAGAG
jgi:RimJ/RimL family protein N-acetyltransferase